jgi:hypothetical protein
MINNKARDMRPGQTALFTRGSTTKGKNTGEESSTGPITPNMTDSFVTMRFMGKERIPGRMGGFTRATGKRTRCLGKVSLLGRTGGIMSGVMWMIKRKATAFSPGPTEESTPVTGRRENNPDRENIKEVINK